MSWLNIRSQLDNIFQEEDVGKKSHSSHNESRPLYHVLSRYTEICIYELHIELSKNIHCKMLTERYGLQESHNVYIEESVAMFLDMDYKSLTMFTSKNFITLLIRFIHKLLSMTSSCSSICSMIESLSSNHIKQTKFIIIITILIFQYPSFKHLQNH